MDFFKRTCRLVGFFILYIFIIKIVIFVKNKVYDRKSISYRNGRVTE